MPAQRKVIYSGEVVKLGIESVELPNGHRLSLEVVRHPGGAAVVAVDTRGQLCLLRQYRHAAGGWIWELPAGKCEQGEDPLFTAQRELQEEAGLCAASWHKLGTTLTSPGFCDEVIHLYLARDLSTVPQQPESHELLESHWIPFDLAQEWACDGTLTDAKSIIGIFLSSRMERTSL